MPSLIADGIVTRYVNYSENDRILTIFTPDRGRIDAKARGCRRAKSPLAPVSQPFAYSEFELFRSGDKYTVSRASVKESFFPIREDIGRYAAGFSMLQLCQDTVQEEEANRDLFLLLYYSLSFLAYDPIEPEDLFLVFLAKYLDIVGYRPTITVCARCGKDLRRENSVFFSASSGGAVCESCAAGSVPVSKTALEAMRRMILLESREINRVKLSDPLKREISGIIIPHAEHALEFGSKALRFYLDFKNQASLAR